MSLILTLAWYELRQRWRAAALYIMLIALFGGAVLAAATGARRTSSALDRFLAYSATTDLSVEGVPFETLRRLPQVADAAQGVYYWMAPLGPDGRPDPRPHASINPIGAVAGLASNRMLLIRGTLPEPGQPLQVAVNETLAKRHRLAPGDRISVQSYSAQQQEEAFSAKSLVPEGPVFSFTVTGVVRRLADLAPLGQPDVAYLGSGQDLFLTPSFWHAHGKDVANLSNGVGSAVRLRPGVSAQAFLAVLHRLPDAGDVQIGNDEDDARVATQARRATQVEALSLWAFAAVSALAGLLLIGQGLDRLAKELAAGQAMLRAVGVTRRQLVAAQSLRGLFITVLGTGAAVAVGLALTPITPIGLTRLAEISPGLRVDIPVLVIGAAGLLLLLTIRITMAAWSVTRRPRTRPASIASSVATQARGAVPGASWRVRALLLRGAPGSRRRTVMTLSSAAGAVALSVASLALAADLTTLVGSPRDQGWNWDVAVGNPHAEEDISSRLPLLARNPSLTAYAPVAYTLPIPADHGQGRVPLLTIGAGHGAINLRVLTGSAPHSPDEVALGREDLKRLGHSIGDTVHLQDGEGRWHRFRVVGQVLLPALLGADFTMGSGGVVTPEGLSVLAPQAVPSQALVRYRPGSDPRQAYASLQRDFGQTVLRASPAPEVSNLQRVQGLPALLAALVGGIALAVLVHTILLALRAGRHSTAVLKSLGFLRRQITSTVVLHAVTTAGWALVVGIPLGILTARWGWLLLNSRLGSGTAPVVPWPGLGLVVLISPVAVILAIYPAARRASRRAPAGALRQE